MSVFESQELDTLWGSPGRGYIPSSCFADCESVSRNSLIGLRCLFGAGLGLLCEGSLWNVATLSEPVSSRAMDSRLLEI